MASQTGYEIMNNEVAGSILTVFPVKRKKRDFPHVQEPVKLKPLKNNDERNTMIASYSNTEKAHWILGISSGFLTQ